MHLTARAVCAFYWFHPLVWIAWRRLCLESERACDDAVLREEDGTVYAAQLVSLARRITKHDALPLLSIAGRSNLSTRVAAMLARNVARGRVSPHDRHCRRCCGGHCGAGHRPPSTR